MNRVFPATSSARPSAVYFGALLIAATGLVALSSHNPAETPQEAQPHMAVRATDDFELTGDGSASQWNKAQWVALNRREADGHSYDTRIKMLYSPTGIYVLMDASDHKLTSTFRQDYQDLWTEDVFEVFLWTDQEHPVYFEYEISPLGFELPLIIPNFNGTFYGWIPWHYEGARRTRKATSAVAGPKQSGAAVQGWRAEVFMPYELFKPLRNVPPQPGAVWRGNFYRVDHDGGRRTSWDWARVGASFHEYEKFGKILFE